MISPYVFIAVHTVRAAVVFRVTLQLKLALSLALMPIQGLLAGWLDMVTRCEAGKAYAADAYLLVNRMAWLMNPCKDTPNE